MKDPFEGETNEGRHQRVIKKFSGLSVDTNVIKSADPIIIVPPN